MLETSNEIAFALTKEHRPFSYSEGIVKHCFHKITKWVVDKST